MNGDFMKTEYIVLGGLFPQGTEEEILKKSSATLPFAASAHLYSIIGGLDKNLGSPVKLLNVLPVGSYPKRYKDLNIPQFHFSHTDGAEDINIGYCNLTLAKKYFCERKVIRHVKKAAEKSKAENKVLIIYSVLPMYLKAARIFKKQSANNKVCLIVPDIPDYTDIDKEGKILFDILRYFRKKRIFKYQDAVDCFVYLSEPMKDYFEGERPYTIIEGICEAEEYRHAAESDFENIKAYGDAFDDGIKSVAYTGSFTKKYGILNLLEAFKKIQAENYRLILCGGGEAEPEIIAAAKKDKRIIYRGAITREEAVQVQSRATVLVNPRTADGEYTKYSFPSKMIEYMLSKRPVLCFRLPAFPNEYDDYLKYFSSESTEKMAEEIVEFCERGAEKLNCIGSAGCSFVEKNKNSIVQCKKILKMINALF